MALSFYDAAEALLGCACEALGAQDPPWEGDCCVVLGEPALDSCCDGGGFAWSRLVRVYPTGGAFPLEDSTADATRCTAQWAAAYEVGVARCVCWDLCDCDAKQENAQKAYGDALAVMRGVICCFSDGGPCSSMDFRVLDLVPYGPQGGCGGSKLSVAIRHQICCPTPIP